MSYRRYIFTILILSATLVSGAVLLNWLIDPYGFYHPEKRHFFNERPAIGAHQNMTKAQVIRKTNPDIVIVGSSRSDYGIDPTHNYFSGKQTYNGSLRGVRMREQKNFIVHAVHSGATHIVWGIDFFTFNAAIAERADFDEDRLYNLNKTNKPKSDLETLLSFTTFIDSIETILRHDEDTLMNGQNNGANLTTDPVRSDKPSDIRMRYFTKLFFPEPYKLFSLDTLDDYKSTLEFLSKNNVKTDIFIAPDHITLLSAIHQSGLMPAYQKWKFNINYLAEKYGFRIYDFTTVSPITTAGISTDNIYYWDMSHYKPSIGNMMLDHLVGEHNLLKASPITSDDLDKLYHDLRVYECTHPTLVSAIRKDIKAAGLEDRLIPWPNCS